MPSKAGRTDTALAKLPQISTQMDITITQALERLGDRGNPSVNSDFNEDAKP